MRTITKTTLLAAAAAFTAFASAPATAEVSTIRAASCFPKGTAFSKRYEAFIADLNKEAKGWKVNYLGGAPAIGSPFTLVQKMARGAFDMVSCTGAYYQNVLPEADALKMWEKPTEEIRSNGGWAYIDKLHQEKNMKLVARLHDGEHFHLYLRPDKPISEPSLKGLHLRVSPIYRNFFQEMGATTQRSNLAQIYTYMENKTVDGYGWPITGLLPDWLKVTGHRVDPGFYSADIELLMNLDTFNKMSDSQRETLMKVAMKHEKLGVEKTEQQIAESRKRQKEAGIKAVELTGEAREKWLSGARDAGWAGIVKVSPEHGPKLREFFAKE